MNKLVESITKPFIVEQSEIKKLIAIYPGRFQPFGPHHKKVYEFLKKKFDDVYIATSDKQQLPRHPLNFKEKAIHISKMGIPKSKVIKETSPYIPKNILKKFDPDTTAVVFAVGKKDASRLSGGKYFQDYKKSKNNMTGFEKHGYVLIAPHISVSAGGMEVSGTSMRELLGSPKHEADRERRFKKMFGYFDKKMFNSMVDRFSQIYENDFNAKDVVIYSPTKRQKKNKKWFDGEGQELLYDLEEESGWPLGSGPTIGHGYPSKKDLKKWKKKTNKVRSRTDSNKKYHFDPVDEEKQNIEECITIAKMFNGEMILGKNRDRNYKPHLKIVRDRTSYGVERCYVVDVHTDWTEGINEYGIGIVNTALFVKRDEKDYNKSKKTRAPSKDGVRVREALGKDSISDAVRSLVAYHGGIKGHTFIGNGKKLAAIENTSRVKPIVKIKNLDQEPVVRTNHGIEHPEAGYQRGNDKLSSELRLINALNVVHDTNNWENLFANFYKHTQDKGPKFDLVRSQNKLWTSSQLAMNLNAKEMVLYLIPDQVQFIGIENNLPEEYEPKIKVKVVNHSKKEIQNEAITVPVEIGDTVLMGRFKNKKVVVKTIDWNEKGDLLINGRSAMKMRLVKQVNIFDNNVTEEQILNFISNVDLSKIIKEVSNATASGIHAVDDGPRYWWGNQNSYRINTDKQARKLGFRVVNYILGNEELPEYNTEYPLGPPGAVTYFPAGDVGAKAGTNIKDDMKGQAAYREWVKFIKKIALTAGYKFVDFLNAEKSIESSKDEPLKKGDPGDTAPPETELKAEKDQHKDYEEVEEQILTKEWWKKQLLEATSAVAAGEPTTGYTHKGKKRYLQPSDMPKGMYQIEFPIADDPYGASDEQRRIYTKKVKNKKELKFPIPSDDSVTAGIGEKGEDFVKSINIDDFPVIAKDVEEEIAFTKKWWKSLLLEGGAYGHMSHPFDDWGLTFGDLKKIIELGLSGNLHREDNVTEKLDGQNLMVSWKDGKLIAARNKGHLKNAGKTAVDIKGMMSMFKGRGEIYNAFVFAVKDLQKAISNLSKKQQDKIFMNGKAFMNLEVMWPKSANVVNYDLTQLVFHGAIEYNDAGTPVGEVKGSARILEGMIRQVNQHVQKHYKIGKPQFLTVPKNQDFAVRKTYYFKKLQKLQNQYAMNDSDTFGLYHQRFWEEFINNAAKQMRYSISNKILQNLVKRWAFYDKSYKIPQIKNDIKDDKFLDWVLSFDKNDHVKFVKSNMKPFELLFFELGAEILKNVSGFLSVNPNKSAQSMKKQVDKAVSSIRAGGNIEKIQKLKTQLEKLNSIGGMNAIVPSEGLVFKYGGKTYKFTGAFAPVNQIIGMLKFSR